MAYIIIFLFGWKWRLIPHCPDPRSQIPEQQATDNRATTAFRRNWTYDKETGKAWRRRLGSTGCWCPCWYSPACASGANDGNQLGRSECECGCRWRWQQGYHDRSGWLWAVWSGAYVWVLNELLSAWQKRHELEPRLVRLGISLFKYLTAA